MIDELLNRFEPESESLLREISKYVDDEMLACISMSDYGNRQDEHLAALRQVRDTGTFPPRIYWCPGEVLELIRWSEPENPEWKPGRTGEFGHWMRAFTCAALLRATREPWNYGDGLATDETTIQMILSLRVLPVDFTPQAVKFFAWLLLNSDPEGQDEQVCAYGIGLLWFALQLYPPVPDEMLIALAQWIIRRAKELYADLLLDAGSLPLRMGVGTPPPSRWESLGAALFELNLSKRRSELRELVELIGLELAG
ncbi:MAG: hypothetical protein ACLQLH_11850 [Terracidiphilus sp.]